jgi:hypothetical protein
MIAVKKCSSEKTVAEKQEGTAFLRVIAHQGHRTRGSCQHKRNSLKQGVKFGAAKPGGSAHGESAEKKNYGKTSIDEASPHDLTL